VKELSVFKKRQEPQIITESVESTPLNVPSSSKSKKSPLSVNLVFEFSYNPAKNFEHVEDFGLIQERSQTEDKMDHTFL
jgi:hypothetical protein